MLWGRGDATRFWFGGGFQEHLYWLSLSLPSSHLSGLSSKLWSFQGIVQKDVKCKASEETKRRVAVNSRRKTSRPLEFKEFLRNFCDHNCDLIYRALFDSVTWQAKSLLGFKSLLQQSALIKCQVFHDISCHWCSASIAQLH